MTHCPVCGEMGLAPYSPTPRERELLRHLSRGMLNKEIADEMGISIHTVKSLTRHLAARLGTHSTRAIAAFAAHFVLEHALEAAPAAVGAGREVLR